MGVLDAALRRLVTKWPLFGGRLETIAGNDVRFALFFASSLTA